MTIIEAITTVLSMAKAELDNSREECANSVEAFNDMDEAVEIVDQWLQGIKAGGLT